jgi:F0F1-type ATP synthase assembly protein I
MDDDNSVDVSVRRDAIQEKSRLLAVDRGLDDTGGRSRMGNRLTKNAGEALRTAGALSTVGLAFVLALVIGFWFGQVLDRWVGTKPLFTIVFFFLGLAAGILNVYRIVSQAYPSSAAGNPSVEKAAPSPRPSETTDGPGDTDMYDEDR